MAELLKFKDPGIRAQRILVSYSDKVPPVVKGKLVQFNDQLLAQGLVPQGVYDPDDRIYTSDASASKLYQACINTVKTDPSKFSKLMKVLSEYPLLDNVVKEMRDTAVKAKLMAQPSESEPQEVPHDGMRQRKGAAEPSEVQSVTMRDNSSVHGGFVGGQVNIGQLTFNQQPQESSTKDTPGSKQTAPEAILNQRKAWPYMYVGIPGLLLAIVGAWFVVAPTSTLLPSSKDALTCKWPLPNSNPVLLQEKQILMELGVEEMSDKLKTSVEQVEKASIAGEKCKDPELHAKMNLVATTVRKIKEKVQEVYGGFHNGAEAALTNLRSMSDVATKGNMVEAMQQINSVHETTEALAQQLDSLKGSMHTKGTELRQALKDLESYQEKAKDNHESQQHKLRAEKQQYEKALNAAASLAREADEKASSAAKNAQKETDAMEAVKHNSDAFGSDDQNPFKKRRAQFRKEQQTFEAEAEDNRRIVEQTRFKITVIEGDIERAIDAYKCTSDAITKMREAAGSVSMPAVSVYLFDEGLKKECEDLHDMINSISSSGGPKGTCRSQVCNKAIKLFAKWQALSKVSLNYFPMGHM